MKTFALLVLGTLLTLAPAQAAAPVSKVLVLTDSHGVGPFGYELLERARHLPGVTVQLEAYGGSAPLWFERGTLSKCGLSHKADNATPPPKHVCGPLHTPKLKDILPGMENQLVVVELGANMVGENTHFVESTTRHMVEAIQRSGARCLWVGPPVMRYFGEQKLARLIEQMAPAMKGDSRYPECEYIDSRPMTSYPAKGGDGIHYSFPAGKPIAVKWAAEIAELVAKAVAAR